MQKVSPNKNNSNCKNNFSKIIRHVNKMIFEKFFVHILLLFFEETSGIKKESMGIIYSSESM